MTVCCLYFCIVLIRIHAERKVGRKRPRCGRPCKDVSILLFHFEAHNRGALLYVFVALSHFLGGQRRTASRTVGNDLEPFVKKVFLPDLFQCPPLGLDKAVVICYIGVLHISPEADRAGEILPHSLVFPYTFLTFVDKRLQAILLDLIFSVQSEGLLYLKLDRQAVGIPSCLSRNHVSLHRAVTRDHVLDDTCEHVSDVRFAICSRRTVVEDVVRASLTLFDTLLKDVVLIPELLDFLFPADKIHICGNFLVHADFPFCLRSAAAMCRLRTRSRSGRNAADTYGCKGRSLSAGVPLRSLIDT